VSGRSLVLFGWFVCFVLVDLVYYGGLGGSGFWVVMWGLGVCGCMWRCGCWCGCSVWWVGELLARGGCATCCGGVWL